MNRISAIKINAILLWACHLLTTTAEEYIPQADTMRILQEQGFTTAVLRETTRPPAERKKDKVSAANGQFISITFLERGHPSCPNEFLNIHSENVLTRKTRMDTDLQHRRKSGSVFGNINKQ